jgi:hypothetical protein
MPPRPIVYVPCRRIRGNLLHMPISMAIGAYVPSSPGPVPGPLACLLKKFAEPKLIGDVCQIKIGRELLSIIIVGNVRTVPNPGAMAFANQAL